MLEELSRDQLSEAQAHNTYININPCHHDRADDSLHIHSYSPVEDFEIIRHEDEHNSYDYAHDEADVQDVQSHDGQNDQEPTEHDQEPTENDQEPTEHDQEPTEHDQEPTDDSQNQQEDYNDQNDYQEDYNDQNDYQDDYNEQNDYQDYADNCSYDQYDQDDY